jgi:hypothetical protein
MLFINTIQIIKDTFIGVPHTDKETKNLINSTKHTFIPESAWVNGIITIKFPVLSVRKPKANKSSKLLFKLRNKSDLVVVFDKVTDKDE